MHTPSSKSSMCFKSRGWPNSFLNAANFALCFLFPSSSVFEHAHPIFRKQCGWRDNEISNSRTTTTHTTTKWLLSHVHPMQKRFKSKQIMDKTKTSGAGLPTKYRFYNLKRHMSGTLQKPEQFFILLFTKSLAPRQQYNSQGTKWHTYCYPLLYRHPPQVISNINTSTLDNSATISTMAAETALKFVLVGDSNVGKSQLSLRFCKEKFNISSQSTVGIEFATRTICLNEFFVKAQLWDTAGQVLSQEILLSSMRVIL